jgi:hypothetical protein
MIDVLAGVRDHYRATGLTERLKTALAALGPEDQQFTPQQLATLDQFHTRGLAATVELAKRGHKKDYVFFCRGNPAHIGVDAVVRNGP